MEISDNQARPRVEAADGLEKAVDAYLGGMLDGTSDWKALADALEEYRRSRGGKQ